MNGLPGFLEKRVLFMVRVPLVQVFVLAVPDTTDQLRIDDILSSIDEYVSSRCGYHA